MIRLPQTSETPHAHSLWQCTSTDSTPEEKLAPFYRSSFRDTPWYLPEWFQLIFSRQQKAPFQKLHNHSLFPFIGKDLRLPAFTNKWKYNNNCAETVGIVQTSAGRSSRLAVLLLLRKWQWQFRSCLWGIPYPHIMVPCHNTQDRWNFTECYTIENRGEVGN